MADRSRKTQRNPIKELERLILGLQKLKDDPMLRQTRSELERKARTRLTARSTDLQRVERASARRVLASLRKLEKLEKDAADLVERRDAFFRMAQGNPTALLEHGDFLRSSLEQLLTEQIAALQKYQRAQLKHLDLVNREDRAVGAAKAREARARQRGQR